MAQLNHDVPRVNLPFLLLNVIYLLFSIPLAFAFFKVLQEDFQGNLCTDLLSI